MRIKINIFLTILVLVNFQFNVAQTLDPDSLSGTYSGTWNNTTYTTSGGASLETSLTGGGSTMQFILDLDGLVGGQSDPDPRNLLGTISSTVITIDTSLAEGDLFLTWDANGVIQWEFTNMTTPGFDSQSGIGAGTSQEINLDYTVRFTGGDSAVGTALLTKQASSIEEYINNIRPDSYRLFNNYPNPFNPSTTIYFSIPEMGDVSLKVYNDLGEEVAELLNENMPSGIHNIRFDASDLPSGVYLYKLTAGSFSQTKKMILIK